ncbi:rhomboid family intramembrane serine protease [Virgibacillus phasianinus]|uniref:Rhomboid family intramembrane serine protease n=1 Tax=Virgibacillus phasianinus TaxID=2017483 RepID=A0A220TZK4_9BACI|nr:rhomboid family intramembrane serine protease [Virgibacillus phasianinus]ASK61257.1 rhomboid family intramembrane serine protease [Virgibacillus phasianinus]
MFIRSERSIKEFIRSYPIVSTIVIIHLVLLVIVRILSLPIGEQLYQWGAGSNILIHEGEYWRLLTSIFFHAGLSHALFNSFALVLFGPALEQMLGKFTFICTYLLAGLAGNLGTYVIEPTAFYTYIGASGAIYGLFGIYIFMVVFRKHLIDSQSARIVVTILVIGLILTFIRPGINVYAHVFGFLGGLALGPLVLANAKPFNTWKSQGASHTGSVQFNPSRWERKQKNKQIFKIILWTVLGILVVLGIFGRFF